MRGIPRHSLAFFLSTLAHASVVLWGQWNFAPDIDVDFDFELQEVEVIDADALQGEQGTPEAKPPEVEQPPEMTPEEIRQKQLEEEKRLEEENRKKAEEEKRKEEEAKKKAEEEAKKNQPYAKRTSQADELAPPQSTFHALLVPKRIRTLPFAEKAADMLAPWPDFEFLVEKGGFDPLRDFDHMVVASANIRDWRQTFLAVDYTMTREQVKAGIERAVRGTGQTIEWEEDGEFLKGNPRPTDPEEPDVDERWFILLPDKVAVYVHESFVEHVVTGPAGEGKTSGNFVANLSRMKKYAARQPRSGFQLKITDIQAAVKKMRSSTLPVAGLSALEISVEAATEPELVLRLEYDDLVGAKKCEEFWNTTVKGYLDDNLGFRIYAGAIYDGAELTRTKTKVVLRAQLTETQITWVLDQIGKMIAKMMKKTPEELEEQRRKRLENWKKRNSGKLGPAGLDAAEPAPPTP